MSSVDLVEFLTTRLDEDELWATEASRRDGQPAAEGGVHWQWEDPEADEVIAPTPDRDEFVGGEDRFRVSLRSRETWSTTWSGELPQFAIPTAEEIPSAVGGHIIRHDPARVLAEVAAKRLLLDDHPVKPETYPRPTVGGREVGGPHFPFGCANCHAESDTGEVHGFGYCLTWKALALPFADHPDYDEAWRP